MRFSPLCVAVISASLVSAQVPAGNSARNATTQAQPFLNTTITRLPLLNRTSVDTTASSSICIIPDGSYCDPEKTTRIYYCEDGTPTSSDCTDDLGDTTATCFTPADTPGDAYCNLPSGTFPPVQGDSSDVTSAAQQNTGGDTASTDPPISSSAASAPQASPAAPVLPMSSKNGTSIDHSPQLSNGVSTSRPSSFDPSASMPQARPNDFVPPPACGAPPVSPVMPPAHPDIPASYPEVPAPNAQPPSEGSPSAPQGGHRGPPTGLPHSPSGATRPSSWPMPWGAHTIPGGFVMPSGHPTRPSGGHARPSTGPTKPESEAPPAPSSSVDGGSPAPPAFTPPRIAPDNKPAAVSSSRFSTMPSPTVTATPSGVNEFSPTFTGAGAMNRLPTQLLAALVILCGLIASMS